MRWVAEDGRDATASAIGVDEGRSVEAIVAGPSDLEAGVGFLEGDRLRVAVAGEARGEVVGRVEEPGVAGFGREQDELVGGNDAPVMGSRPSLDIANLIGETKPTTVAQELSGVLGGRPSFPSRSATRAVSAAFVAMRIPISREPRGPTRVSSGGNTATGRYLTKATLDTA